MLEKLKRIEGKATYIIGLIASIIYVYNTHIKDNPIAVYIHNQRVQGEALDSELDLDKVVFNKYHLRLFHSNKNSKGQIKFSYLKYKGKYYKSWVDPTSGFWVYRDGNKIHYLKELSH